jgi:flavin-binding protein dodecin
MKQVATLLFSICMFLCHAQSSIRPIEIVEAAKQSRATFSNVQLFDVVSNRGPLEEGLLEDYQLVNLKAEVLQQVRQNQPSQITLIIPADFRDQSLEVELVQVDLFSHDFQVTKASSGRAADVNLGLHYRGIIKGHPGSVAAVSIFKNDIMGMFSSAEDGNLVLGKMKGNPSDGQFIIYPDSQLQSNFNLDCSTDDDGVGYTRKDLEPRPSTRDLSDCVRLYFEADYDIFLDKGSVQATTNYVTGIYNEVATIYANESINTVVSEIVVWDQPSPYSSNSSSGMLNDFQAYHNNSSWNGDLGHLLSYQASGGIAAGFNGICNPNRDNSLCFSSINSTFAQVPTYSWTIMVVTHEFGHLFGSRHTHACVWNGNNTAIDGCSGNTEGACSLPGIPSVGGTIMSYCHLTSVGINFNEGFGPQPGNVIRNEVDFANCLIPCGPPTCDDGIQNGNETGVDCGGPDCPACPTCFDGIQNGDEVGVDCGGPDCPLCPCNNNLQLAIVLDNYPGETTWEVTDGNGAVWFSGGPYGNFPNGATVVENICLPDGCFTFTIFDSYGDGICCSYGNGSYTLTNLDNGMVIASGGAFNSIESTPFCLSSPTCDDGIQNGDEEGVDCGGSNCPPCVIPCTDNELTLDINFDVFPFQVTWDFADANGNVILAGGPYDQSLSSDNIQESICLPDGCYTFTMYDSGGNGLCCRFGAGNYTLTENATGNNLAAGSIYGFSQTSNICLGNPVQPTCDDGIQNGDETGIDCGGSNCPACPTCFDGIQNGGETDVDCGGPDCPACPTCFDGVQNGDEEGVDCGGTNCPPCNNPPSCNDGIQNGDETGIDCGGSNCPACPTCDDGIQNGGETDVDCGGPDCPACPTCFDGIQNGGETDVDCGGPDCPACPTCFDGIQNGGETDVDCGGPDCPACPTCDDGIQNGDEEDVDCGGSNCPACVSCNDGIQNGDEEGIDCGGSICLPCFTCDDGIQNGDETGVDCGGSICPICPGTCNYDLSLTLNFDFLPNQTSWQITNVLGTVLYSGGPYTSEPANSTLVIDNLCFDAGCYNLTIFDSGNNGMCCRFGQGSYSLQDSNGNTLAQGGEFDAQEATLFCLGSAALGLAGATEELQDNQTASTLTDLAVFPNPVKDVLTITYTSTAATPVELRCTSLTGKLMQNLDLGNTIGASRVALNINNYPSGVYVIHLIGEDGAILSNRFVVID